MNIIRHHKVVASLPSPLEPNSVYYVRRGVGFDQYVTNSLGDVVAYPANPAGGGGVQSPTISRIITSTDPEEPMEDGDMLIVLPQPRVVAASHSELTYGGQDALTELHVQVPLDVEVGDKLLLLVGSAYNPAVPTGYTLVLSQDAPNVVLTTGLGRTTVFQRTATNGDAGSTVSINQPSSGRMAAMVVAIRSEGGTPTVSEVASLNFHTGTTDHQFPHPIADVQPNKPGCLAISLFACALALPSSNTSVTWPPGWIAITPTDTPATPGYARVRTWAAYKQLRRGESTSGSGHCTHSVGTHDGSNITLLLEARV